MPKIFERCSLTQQKKFIGRQRAPLFLPIVRASKTIYESIITTLV